MKVEDLLNKFKLLLEVKECQLGTNERQYKIFLLRMDSKKKIELPYSYFKKQQIDEFKESMLNLDLDIFLNGIDCKDFIKEII